MNKAFALLAALCFYTINGLIMPMTKSDGSLDVSSLLSHIALLEQSIENKASVADMTKLAQSLERRASAADLTKLETELTTSKTKLEDELVSAKTKISVLETKLNQCSCISPDTQNSASSSEVKSLQTDVVHLKKDVFQLQSLNNRTEGSSMKGSSTFTRWGRTSCPADSTVVYKGYTGGTWWDYKGGSSSVVCLPEDPIYATHTTNDHYIAQIYGSEYETSYSGNPFQHLHNDDIPCVVCENSRSTTVMIPGRNQCYQGWALDYWGYLMGGNPHHASANYICIDSDAKAVPGGKPNEDGQTFYNVESKCGSLPCPPYEENWELSCVVCWFSISVVLLSCPPIFYIYCRYDIGMLHSPDVKNVTIESIIYLHLYGKRVLKDMYVFLNE